MLSKNRTYIHIFFCPMQSSHFCVCQSVAFIVLFSLQYLCEQAHVFTALVLSRPVKMVLWWNGSMMLSGDIAGILASCALEGQSCEHKGSVSRLVSSTCLIYCPAAFEVGQAEFTSLCFFVISPPRLQPRWGPFTSTAGYRKCLSLVASGHRPWTIALQHV